MGNGITFLPGYEPGITAGGVPDDKLMDMAAANIGLTEIPVGDSVATKFPWLRIVSETLTAGAQVFVKRNQFDGTFMNDTPHPLEVHEVRFYIFPGDETGTSSDLMVKLNIDGRREIVNRWLPWQSLQTEEDRYIYAFTSTNTFWLPAPYFLQRASLFQMDFTYPTNPASDRSIYVGLHGVGVEDNEPISLFKQVTQTTAIQANEFWSVVFDEDRDGPLRDAIITHISFGDNSWGNENTAMDALSVRFGPPEGPPWHRGEFIPTGMLARQHGIDVTGDPPYNRMCIHRPVVPYTLYPGESLEVQLWNRSGESMAVVTGLQGIQKGHR